MYYTYSRADILEQHTISIRKYVVRTLTQTLRSVLCRYAVQASCIPVSRYLSLTSLSSETERTTYTMASMCYVRKYVR